jgi:isoaspartyl peptidase/L-asparaginase-like protein (Ntn-hydrolase superfamily)
MMNGAAMIAKGTSSSGVLAEMPGKVVDNMISIPFD